MRFSVKKTALAILSSAANGGSKGQGWDLNHPGSSERRRRGTKPVILRETLQANEPFLFQQLCPRDLQHQKQRTSDPHGIRETNLFVYCICCARAENPASSCGRNGEPQSSPLSVACNNIVGIRDQHVQDKLLAIHARTWLRISMAERIWGLQRKSTLEKGWRTLRSQIRVGMNRVPRLWRSGML